MRRQPRRSGWLTASLGHVQNENAWVFCPEESLGASVKAYMEFEKQLKEKLPKEQRAKVRAGSSIPWRF
jgi:hypothetical protein